MKSKYEKEKLKAKNKYFSIGKVFNPAFAKDIYFNAQGFNHLVYGKGNMMRSKEQQLARFRLLDKAVGLISSNEVFKLSKTADREKLKKGIKKISIEKQWCCDGEKNGSGFRVILRQRDNGNIHFLSVIPLGKTQTAYYPFASLLAAIPNLLFKRPEPALETVEISEVETENEPE